MSLISALINTKHQHTVSILNQYLCFWIRVDCNLIVTIYAFIFLTSLQTWQNFRLSNVPFNLHFQSHDWSFTHIWPSFSPPSFSDLLFPPLLLLRLPKSRVYSIKGTLHDLQVIVLSVYLKVSKVFQFFQFQEFFSS